MTLQTCRSRLPSVAAVRTRNSRIVRRKPKSPKSFSDLVQVQNTFPREKPFRVQRRNQTRTNPDKSALIITSSFVRGFAISTAGTWEKTSETSDCRNTTSLGMLNHHASRAVSVDPDEGCFTLVGRREHLLLAGEERACAPLAGCLVGGDAEHVIRNNQRYAGTRQSPSNAMRRKITNANQPAQMLANRRKVGRPNSFITC